MGCRVKIGLKYYIYVQKFDNKGGMDDWQVTFKQQSLKLATLPLTPLDLIKQEQDRPARMLQFDEMEQSRQREARCISNYFNIPSIATFAQTLITAAKVLRVDHQPILNKIENSKIKLPGTILENAEQTTRSRIELCFSRRWRELQWTIYLLVQQYETPQLNLRTRVLVINQRGLILQTFSNIHSLKTFTFLAKMLHASYTRLQNLVVLEAHPRRANLDDLTLLRATFPNVNVMLVSYGERARVESLNGSNWVGGCSYYIMQSQIKLSIFSKLDIILWYVQQNNQQILRMLSLGLAEILRYESQVVRWFKDWQYNQHQFNQKEFLLRLFSFYFNCFVLGMHNKGEDQMKSQVLGSCTDQMVSKNRQMLERNNGDEVHSFSNMESSLQCPVCRKRSKITCMKCCTEFGAKFAICQITCFQKFHQNRIAYAGKINKRRIVDDLAIENREKDKEQREGNEEELEPVIARVQNIQQLKQKWRTAIEGYQKDYEHFVRMSQMNFVPQKFVDRIQLLRAKIKQIGAASPSMQSFPKQEQ